jgi:hypothetical protein
LDSETRKAYLDLAQRFRDVANRVAVSQMQSDDESFRLADRKVGIS